MYLVFLTNKIILTSKHKFVIYYWDKYFEKKLLFG